MTPETRMLVHSAIEFTESETRWMGAVQANEAKSQIESDARALWAVRVLDRWADLEETRSWEVYRMRNGWEIELRADQASSFHQEATPDAARIAAAEALVAEDPSLAEGL